MLKAYVNYPNPKISIHRKLSCADIQKMTKAGQRYVRINPATISTELQNFYGKVYTFSATASQNDMWIEVDFGDKDFEAAVVAYIHRLIGNHYLPIAGIAPTPHCQ